MASLTRGTTFVDGVANDVTAAKLSALVDNATPTSGFIQDRTAETITATNDTLLIGDASDSNNLKRITVANFAQTLPTAKVTTGTIDTGTFGTTTSTAATITTGTIPTLTSITKITSGTGTAAAPAISPTGDTNTGIFFPDADTVAFAEGGTEAMRIDSAGDVGIGTTNPVYKLDVSGLIASQSNQAGIVLTKTNNAANNKTIQNTIDGSGNMVWQAINDAGAGGGNSFSLIRSAQQINSIEAQSSGTTWFKIDNSATNVGIGTTSPDSKLSIYGANTSDSGAIYSANILNTATAASGVGSGLAFGTNISTTGVTNIAAMAGIEGIKENGTTGNYASALKFTTRANGGNLTEKVRIDSAGNFGIGTTGPASPLHVRGSSVFGTVNVQSLSANAEASISFYDSADTNADKWVIGKNVTLSADQLCFYKNGILAVLDTNGNFGIGVAAPVNRLEVVGSFGRGAPVTKTADFTLAATENWIIVNKATTSCTATLPAASSWTGREFTIKTLQALTVVSASANVVPINGTTAGTAILTNVAGSWSTLVSNGTNWVIMAGS
jgi:hypothetical protein